MIRISSYGVPNDARHESVLHNWMSKVPRYCWLIVAGYVLAPMTSWRIWKVGPAEVLCLLGCLDYLRMLGRNVGGVAHVRFIPNFLSDFWFGFLLASGIGCIWCVFNYRSESIPTQMLTWLYFAFVSVVVFDACSKVNDLDRILVMACSIASVWYALLYIYGNSVSTSFFGAELWFGGRARYTGGAGNPHQLALPMAVGSVVLAADAVDSPRMGRKAISIILAILSTWLLWQTESSTGKMSLVVGLAMLCYARISDRRARAVVLCLIAIVCIVFSESLFNGFMRWIASDSNGEGRLEIYATYPTAFIKSPIFGLGPGSHAYDGAIEFHNTYLEVLAMGGLTTGFLFLLFSFQVLGRVKYSPVSIAIYFTLYAFGFSGFAMRRLVYWLMLCFAMIISEQNSQKHNRATSEKGVTDVIMGYRL